MRVLFVGCVAGRGEYARPVVEPMPGPSDRQAPPGGQPAAAAVAVGGYVWWVSPHDDESHAIPRIQADGGDEDGTVDTACDKVLLVDRAQHAPNGVFCRRCLVKVGRHVPDRSWQG